MKLNSVQLRLSNDSLSKLDAISNLTGHNKSGVIRLLIDQETENARLTPSIAAEDLFSKGKDDHYEYVKLEANDGARELRFFVQPYRSLCCAHLTNPDYSSFNLDEVRGQTNIIDNIIDVLYSSYDWDTPAFREMCLRLGVDPDEKRPKYTIEAEPIAEQLHLHFHKLNMGNPTRHTILDIIQLLRTDMIPEISMYDSVKRALRNMSGREKIDLYDKAFDLIDTGRLSSTVMLGTVITFLPSWKGRGYNATFNLWVSNPEKDGWPKSLYKRVEGVALLPSGELSITQKTLIRRLTKQGVFFLSQAEADKYIEEEGFHWLQHHNSLNNETNRYIRTPIFEKIISWLPRINKNVPKQVADKPLTPLYDQYKARFDGEKS